MQVGFRRPSSIESGSTVRISLWAARQCEPRVCQDHSGFRFVKMLFSRAPMLSLALPNPLFEFEYDKPHCDPLLALPPTIRSFHSHVTFPGSRWHGHRVPARRPFAPHGPPWPTKVANSSTADGAHLTCVYLPGCALPGRTKYDGMFRNSKISLSKETQRIVGCCYSFITILYLSGDCEPAPEGRPSASLSVLVPPCMPLTRSCPAAPVR